MSKWGEKLQAKLSALTEASSKESIQTLALWIWFNRKHKDTFIASMREILEKHVASGGSGSSSSILLSVLHEVFLLHLKQTEKWDGAADLRVSLAESLILPFAGTALPAAKIQSSLELWDTHNSFSGPTLINQILNKLSSATDTSVAAPLLTTPTVTVAPMPAEAVPTKEADKPSEPNASAATLPEKASLKVALPEYSDMEGSVAKKPKISRSSSIPGTPSGSREVVYDFEAAGIPPAPVDAKELADHCRNIAALQIPRELQSEAATSLSGMLQGLPQAVRAFIAESAEQDGELELPESTAREFCANVSDALLDLDLQDQLAKMQVYRDIVTQQQVARQQLRDALIASRCQFRADEAAAAYYAVDDTALKHRAQLLVDAMDLEGLEVQPVTMTGKQEEELPALSWYQAASEPAAMD